MVLKNIIIKSFGVKKISAEISDFCKKISESTLPTAHKNLIRNFTVFFLMKSLRVQKFQTVRISDTLCVWKPNTKISDFRPVRISEIWISDTVECRNLNAFGFRTADLCSTEICVPTGNNAKIRTISSNFGRFFCLKSELYWFERLVFGHFGWPRPFHI